MEKWIQLLPGFRTGQLWKQIVAGIFYANFMLLHLLILLMVTTGDKDIRLAGAQIFVVFLLLVTVPLILLTIFPGVVQRLPLFGNPRTLPKVFAWVIGVLLLLAGTITILASLDKHHTANYYEKTLCRLRR
jgi:magnesium-transporting ATPase (P-type)